MASPLISYAEAAEQVHLFILQQADAAPSDTLPPEIAPFASAPPENIPLAAAAGRVLAAPILADRDQPPFPRSTRDGFACRAAEANSHLFLFRAGQVRAGETASGLLQTGEVWEIMTGAPVPDGADAVFMIEHADFDPEAAQSTKTVQSTKTAQSTETTQSPVAAQSPVTTQSPEFVRLAAPRSIQPGENIVPRAAEARAGDLLIPSGTRLAPPQIALAAQCGCDSLSVASRPRVAILATGDELVPVGHLPGPSQIRNSNSPMLAALVTAAGGIPIVLPAVPDQEAALDAVLPQALNAGLLLITGGISAGRFDLVEDALTRMGARFFFGGVAIQPGKPVVFGQLPRQGNEPLPFFALPGNPISSAVTFHLFAAPLLAALGGDTAPLPRFVHAQLITAWRGKPGLTRFLPAYCDFGLAAEVRLVSWQGSGDLAAFARSNCLLVIPAEAQIIPEGSTVQILLT